VLKETHMPISNILRQKGHQVVKAHSTDTVLSAVRKFAEHRIGAVVVEDAWMRPVGIFFLT
jgi:CBS domain-containing protein